MIKKIPLIIVFILISTQIFADITGHVSKVIDADTVIVVDISRVSHKVRLLGIDAPERRQYFGEDATQYLTAKVLNKNLTVIGSKKDRYNRLLGKLIHEGKDVNLDLVSSGMAWHYKKYQESQELKDKFLYSNAEIFARKNKLGPWSAPSPIPPWDWRRNNK